MTSAVNLCDRSRVTEGGREIGVASLDGRRGDGCADGVSGVAKARERVAPLLHSTSVRLTATRRKEGRKDVGKAFFETTMFPHSLSASEMRRPSCS